MRTRKFVCHGVRSVSFSENLVLREKYRYSELFWSVFSRIWTEYGEILGISPYSVRLRENTDQNNSEYGDFSCSVEYVRNGWCLI